MTFAVIKKLFIYTEIALRRFKLMNWLSSKSKIEAVPIRNGIFSKEVVLFSGHYRFYYLNSENRETNV